MFEHRINWSVFRDLSWWHWAATVPLLALHLLGSSWSRLAAIGLCVLAGGYFIARLKQLRPYPVQTRLAYLGLLLCGWLPEMDWLYWLPLVGTTTMVIAGYCPLLRLLSVAPWNRSEPLSASLLWRTFVREPCAGGLVRWTETLHQPPAACCSLPTSCAPISCSLAGQPASRAVPQELHRMDRDSSLVAANRQSL